MRADEIRSKFIEFFEKNGHTKVSSSSLIPHNDPTLLFANAGMNQFKDYFTGREVPPFPRAVTVQKCVRAGGKHNDLENVGFTARHHTFFEMLGNFSFGDYFKSEAIALAWKFLTEELKIPKDKLYVTVHDSDDEAKELWIKEQGVPADRIFKMGDKDNFWEMGETGPCGPCSEIFYDHGEKYASGNFDHPMKDEERCVEVWNLVFMQFEKHKDGTRTNLPKPSVDTGAGLERLAAVMQKFYWNYDTDLFTALFKKLEELSGKKYSDPQYVNSFRVIGDHLRSATMLITDGAMPSNEGRGYVLRRIIRRAVRHANELGLTRSSLYKLVPTVFETLGEEYAENKANQALAEKSLKQEEDKFRATLNNGLKILNESIEELKSKNLPGEVAFKLYDTYGFPLDLTETILKEKGISVDSDGFEKLMNERVEQSKKHQKFHADASDLEVFYAIKEKHGETSFTGYKTLKDQGTLLAKEKFGDGYALVFDKTPFYGESGGQVGDKGTINGTVEVLDTQKPIDDFHVHLVENADELEVGKSYSLEVNEKLRNQTIKNHSATHLLQAALIKILGPHIKQAGSYVNEEMLRFDFTHDSGLSEKEISETEELVNQEIRAALPVKDQIMNKDEAVKQGAMALFGEKYGDEVRVIQMGGFSTELCGGTHVNNTSDIDLFKVYTESALAAGVRRLIAYTGEKAKNYLSELDEILNQVNQITNAKKSDSNGNEVSQLAKALSTSPNEVPVRLQGIIDDLLKIEKENSNLESELGLKKSESLVSKLKDDSTKNAIEKVKGFIKLKKTLSKINTSLKDQKRSSESADLFVDPIQLKSCNLFVTETESSPKELRKVSDNFIDKQPKDVLFLYTNTDDKFAFILRTNKSNKNINLSTLTKDIFSKIEGRGGGKPDMTQGSANSKDFNTFLEHLKQEL